MPARTALAIPRQRKGISQCENDRCWAGTFSVTVLCLPTQTLTHHPCCIDGNSGGSGRTPGSASLFLKHGHWRETASWLRASAVFAEDLDLVPRTHTGWLTTACHFTGADALVSMGTCTQVYTSCPLNGYIFKINTKKLLGV